jgi:two-component system phosphate regulon sensor histidine kinase PhoR
MGFGYPSGFKKVIEAFYASCTIPAIRVKYIQQTMDAKMYQILFDSIPEGIILLNEKDVITHVNKGAACMLGRGVQEVVGSTLQAVIPSMAENSFQTDTISFYPDQEHEIILAVTSTCLEGIPPHKRALVLRDITASQASHQMQTYFLANITHEFRTPLSALKASIELILDSLGEIPQAELERLLRSIHYSVAGLQTLIDNLLESASIESGHFRIQPKEARLDEVIGEAVHVMTPLLQRRKQGLQIEMDWSLPPFSLDPTRITQVIVNLLSNASKYSPTGKEIRIKVSPSTDNLILVSVVDQGPGLSPRDRKNLFKKFVRVNDSTGEQFGVGLGLSVVKTIVEAHGGTVGVDDNPEGGSTFWFTLPMKTDSETFQ